MKVFCFTPTQAYSGGLVLISATSLNNAKLVAHTMPLSLRYVGTWASLNAEALRQRIVHYTYVE